MVVFCCPADAPETETFVIPAAGSVWTDDWGTHLTGVVAAATETGLLRFSGCGTFAFVLLDLPVALERGLAGGGVLTAPVDCCTGTDGSEMRAGVDALLAK